MDGCGAGQVQIWYQRFEAEDPHSVWHAGSPGLVGERTCGADFGSSVAIGDFNGDGYDDLAIGASGDAINNRTKAGGVHVLYGSLRHQLTSEGAQIFGQGHAGLSDSAEYGDAFGTALASGDFDCDGHADLAVGVPGENDNAGAIHILFGGPRGLSGLRSQFIEHTPAGPHPTRAYFGSFLAAGNIDADHVAGYACDDLAVGIPGASSSRTLDATVIAAGAVAVLHGGSGGIDTKAQLWQQGLAGLLGEGSDGDEFGRGVWIIDDNGDGYGDLLAYSAGDDTFYSIYGSPAGLTSSGARSRGPKNAVKGKLRDACIWACEFAWLLLPPGPECDCSACEILAKPPPSPCPNCV